MSQTNWSIVELLAFVTILSFIVVAAFSMIFPMDGKMSAVEVNPQLGPSPQY